MKNGNQLGKEKYYSKNWYELPMGLVCTFSGFFSIFSMYHKYHFYHMTGTLLGLYNLYPIGVHHSWLGFKFTFFALGNMQDHHSRCGLNKNDLCWARRFFLCSYRFHLLTLYIWHEPTTTTGTCITMITCLQAQIFWDVGLIFFECSDIFNYVPNKAFLDIGWCRTEGGTSARMRSIAVMWAPSVCSILHHFWAFLVSM